MGDAARFLEAHCLPPLGLGADPDRGPGVNADAGRIASRRLGHRAQLVESGDRIIARRIIQGHPTIAPFYNALHRHVGMAAVPDRDPAACRQWIDPGILDRVVLAGEGDVRLGPQRLYNLDLLLRAAAPVAEIFIEANELDRVPSDPDAKTESSAAQHVKRGGLLVDEYRLALGEDQHLGRELDIPLTRGEKAE